jgi:sugar lactone lactonase YvrE
MMEDLEMKVRIFRIVALGCLFLGQMLAAPELALAEFTPSNQQEAALVLGQPGFITNANTTTQTGMSAPYGLAVDPTTHKVFVADTSNHRVLRFASVISLNNGAAAEGVLGQSNFTSGFSNRGGTTEANTLSSPSGVFVDSSGRLWVADSGNHRVLRFDNAANLANGISANGVLGQTNFTDSNFATSQSGMFFPYDVFVDSSGILWVADGANNRVVRFNSAATKPNGANANGVLGQPGFNSNTAATSQNGMDSPFGVYVDQAGRLWVAEFGNNRVLRFNGAASKPNGAGADGVLGQVDFNSAAFACSQDGMDTPIGLNGDKDGRLYVTDSLNHRVLIFDGAAGLTNGANADNVLGQPDFTTCTANTWGLSETSLDFPTRAFYDPSAKVLWVADRYNNRVLMYGNTAPTATLVLGQVDFTSAIASTTQSGATMPYDVRTDPTTGKIFVADTFNNRVLRFISVSALSNGAQAEAVLGQADFVSGSPNRGGLEAANTLSNPFGLFLDSSGRLWVADLGNNRVLRFDNASTKPDGANADGVLGQPDFNSSGGATSQSGMFQPSDVFVDWSGQLWVADQLNNRVLRFDNASSMSNGASADGVLGQVNFNSNTAATTRNGMTSPGGLFMDPNGHLWVTDGGNNRVLRFDNASNKLNGDNADRVLGQMNFTANTSACTRGGMNRPIGISGDSTGRIYVAEDLNHRLLIFENVAGLPNGANANDLLGQPNFTLCRFNTGGISSASLSAPTKVFYDTRASVLWVADMVNSRVLMYGTPQFRIFLPIVRR